MLKINEQKSEGVIVSLNCETDFVAKNKDFLNFASEILNVAENVNSMESLLNSKNGGLSISDKLIEQTGIIGRKNRNWKLQKLSENILEVMYTPEIKLQLWLRFQTQIQLPKRYQRMLQCK